MLCLACHTGPSATFQARSAFSQRRAKRKRDETEAPPPEGNLPRTLRSGLLPHDSSAHKSQRTMPMDSSFHAMEYNYPGVGSVHQRVNTSPQHGFQTSKINKERSNYHSVPPGQFGRGAITPPEGVIQVGETNRGRNIPVYHHSRRGAAQTAVNSLQEYRFRSTNRPLKIDILSKSLAPRGSEFDDFEIEVISPTSSHLDSHQTGSRYTDISDTPSPISYTTSPTPGK